MQSLNLLKSILSSGKRKCPFKIGDMVYPKMEYKHLFDYFPNGAREVIGIRSAGKEQEWFFINVGGDILNKDLKPTEFYINALIKQINK